MSENLKFESIAPDVSPCGFEATSAFSHHIARLTFRRNVCFKLYIVFKKYIFFLIFSVKLSFF